MTDELITRAGIVAVLVVSTLATLSVALHHFLARWWRTPEGRHMFAFKAVLALILDTWSSRLIFPEGTWFAVVRLSVFVLLAPVLVWHMGVMVRIHRTERRRRLETQHDLS